MKKWKIESDLSPNQVEVRPEHSRTRRHKTTRNKECLSRRRPNFGRVILTGLLAVGLVAAPTVAFAESEGESKALVVSREGGLGAASAVSSLVYGPVKLVYAVGGLIVGGFAWAFTAGDRKVAETVFTRSVRGTYVITPEILLGEQRLEFIGRDIDEAEAPPAAVASAGPASWSDEQKGYDEMGW